MSETELITATPSGELSIPQLAGNMEKLREVMRSVMREGSDYGVVPGTNSKPTLLKPGGEKLAMMFRFAPEFHETMTELESGHREYQVKCRLIHVPTQAFAGEASAVCSTMETKYRYRGGAIACPECGKSSVIKGKAQYGGGWLCWQKKGGCGAKFPADQFSEAMLERIENPDIADCYNTVKQIAQKRAFISAIKTATATSELFTQDVEDGVVPGVEVEPPRAAKPKPEESADWLKLKKELTDIGCREGHQDEAEAVLKFVGEGKFTLLQCFKDPAVARDAIDAIDTARTLMHMTNEEIMEKAGLREPAPA